MININGKQYEEDVKVISSGGRSYKMPLEDYLEEQAYQNGYENYKSMYLAGARLRGYEDLNPEDLENWKKERYQNTINDLKTKLHNLNLLPINLTEDLQKTGEKGVNYITFHYYGELENGKYFYIHNENLNLFTTSNNPMNYYNSTTKELDINNMKELVSYPKNVSELFITYLESNNDLFYGSKNQQKQQENIDTHQIQKSFKNEPKNDINYSKYQKLFNTYCYSQTLDLKPTKDKNGNEYPTLMTAKIDNQLCKIVNIKGKETKLNYIDEDGNIHSTESNPNIFACDLKFRYIDTTFKEVMNKYWDKLNLDEIMKVYETLADELERFSSKSKN